MTAQNQYMERAARILEQRGLLLQYEKFLLTPYFVQEIILLTNNGNIKRALRNICKAEELVVILSTDLSTEDKVYFIDTIKQLRDSVIASIV